MSTFRTSIIRISLQARRSFHTSRLNAAVYPQASKETFTKIINNSSGRVVLVDFYADWCKPCHILSPILEKLSAEPNTSANGKPVDLVKVDLESSQGQLLAGEYDVRALPTVYIFKDGRQVDLFVGAQPEAEVKEILAKQ